MGILKKIFCRHKEKVCVTNIYGDLINDYNARSIWECTRCKRLFRSYSLEPSCDIINFNLRGDDVKN